MAELVVRGGTVVDAGGSRRVDVLVADGVIRAVEADLDVPAGAQVLDADGCLVAPGLVDLHTHLRQPGREEAETVETGARAAALGGYTAIVAMPNTEPTIDSAGVAREVLELGRTAAAEVAVAGAITVGRAGERLAPMAELAALGVRLFTDDGAGVQDGGLMRRALDYAAGLRAQGTPVVLAQHCEDERLAARRLDARGRVVQPARHPRASRPRPRRRWSPATSPSSGSPAARCTSSTCRPPARSSSSAPPRPRGWPSPPRPRRTTSPSPTASSPGYDPVFKVNPPLRTDDDVAAIKAGLVDRTIDAIATDHAPHAPEMKDRPFDQAPPGMLGLETALAVALTELPLPPERVLALLSWQPAMIAGLAAGTARWAGLADRPRRPRRARRRRQPVRRRSRRHLDRRRRPAGQPQPEHAVRRPGAHAAASATPSCGASRSSSTRDGPAMSRPAAHCWCSPTARSSRARRPASCGRSSTGEVVFNTALSGYQEVVTDPSYAGQVVAFTYPHIGNYGTNAADDEAPRPFCRGVVVRDLTAEPSNWRATEGLEAFLVRHDVPAVTGIDTRRLTRHLRDRGRDAVRVRDGRSKPSSGRPRRRPSRPTGTTSSPA